jgi:hypothetical protein
MHRKVLFLRFPMFFRGMYGYLSVFTGVSRLHFWIPDLAWVRQKRRPKAGVVPPSERGGRGGGGGGGREGVCGLFLLFLMFFRAIFVFSDVQQL